MPEPTIVYEHSGDLGRTWNTLDGVNPRSPIVAILADRIEGEIWDDGYGNLYRRSER